MGRQRHGFTLIEILVSLAVITVIMAIALPAYQYSRQKAYQVQCASNLRQLGIAVSAYAQDFNGYLPPYINMLPEDYPLWAESIESGCIDLGYPDYHLLYRSLDPYVKNNKVWFCPTDPYAGVDVLHWGVRHLCSSYSFYFLWSPPLSNIVDSPRFPGDATREPPCQCMIIRDANTFVGMPIKATFPNQRGRGCEHFKGINELYLDGHVKWRRSSWSSSSE